MPPQIAATPYSSSRSVSMRLTPSRAFTRCTPPSRSVTVISVMGRASSSMRQCPRNRSIQEPRQAATVRAGSGASPSAAAAAFQPYQRQSNIQASAATRARSAGVGAAVALEQRIDRRQRRARGSRRRPRDPPPGRRDPRTPSRWRSDPHAVVEEVAAVRVVVAGREAGRRRNRRATPRQLALQAPQGGRPGRAPRRARGSPRRARRSRPLQRRLARRARAARANQAPTRRSSAGSRIASVGRSASGGVLRDDEAAPRVREHDRRREPRARRERLHRVFRPAARAEAGRRVARNAQHEVAPALAQAETPVGDAARRAASPRGAQDRARARPRRWRSGCVVPAIRSRRRRRARQLRQPATARNAYAR